MIAEAIYARMAGFAALTALVGGATSPRIYPSTLPQGVAYPAVTYLGVSAVRSPLMVQDAGLVASRWQITAWAPTYLAARDVADQIERCWDRFRGTVAGLALADTFLVGRTDLVDPEAIPRLYGAAVDVMIHYPG